MTINEEKNPSSRSCHSKKPQSLPLDLVILDIVKNPRFYCCFVGFLDWILRSFHFLRMTEKAFGMTTKKPRCLSLNRMGKSISAQRKSPLMLRRICGPFRVDCLVWCCDFVFIVSRYVHAEDFVSFVVVLVREHNDTSVWRPCWSLNQIT